MIASLAQTTVEVDSGGLGAAFWIIYGAFFLFYIIIFWRVFEKAGEPGWAAIIPIYNIYVELKIVGRPWWWLLLLLIPIVNIVILFIVAIDLAKSFGKGTGFGIGVALLPIIFVAILAFGDARYLGPAGASPEPGRGMSPPGAGPTAPPPPPPPTPA